MTNLYTEPEFEATTRLALGVDGVGKHGVGVGVVQGILGVELAEFVISVTQVFRSCDLAEMSHLVQSSSAHVLAVAAAGKNRKLVPVDVAVSLIALRGDGVSQDGTGVAVALNISAVVLGDTAGGVAALSSNVLEDLGHLGANRAGRALVILLHLGGRAVGGGISSVVGQANAVLENLLGS